MGQEQQRGTLARFTSTSAVSYCTCSSRAARASSKGGARDALAQPDLSCRPVVYFRVLISLSNPLISWKIFARNISFILLSHVKRLPRRTRAPKAKPAPTPLIILPSHLSTKLTLAGSHYGATPAYLRYPKALKVRRVLSRPHHGKSVQPTRGAR